MNICKKPKLLPSGWQFIFLFVHLQAVCKCSIFVCKSDQIKCELWSVKVFNTIRPFSKSDVNAFPLSYFYIENNFTTNMAAQIFAPLWFRSGLWTLIYKNFFPSQQHKLFFRTISWMTICYKRKEDSPLIKDSFHIPRLHLVPNRSYHELI